MLFRSAMEHESDPAMEHESTPAMEHESDPDTLLQS